MTIPSFPWFAEVPNNEFGTSGFLENAAWAADLPLNPPSAGKPATLKGWWGSDLIGKSSFHPPVTLCASIDSPVHGGRGPLEHPGYFYGVYLSYAAPVSENWASTDTSAGYTYSFTSNHDLGLRGYNVKDARLRTLGFDPGQYLILDTNANQPVPLPSHKMKSPVLVYVQGRFDYHVDLGYYVGDQWGNAFTNWVSKMTFKDGGDGRNWWICSYELPSPGPDQIITPGWWTDRGGDRIQFTLIPWNAGYTEYKFDSITISSQGSPVINGLAKVRNHFRHPDGPLATLDGTEVILEQNRLLVKFVRPYAGYEISVFMINKISGKNFNGNPFQEFKLQAVSSSKVAGGYTEYSTTNLGWSSLAWESNSNLVGGKIRFFDSLSVQCVLHPETADGIWCYS